MLNADKTNGANVLPVVVMRVASPPFCLAVFRLMRAFRTIRIQKPLMNPFMSILGEKGGGVPPKKTTILSHFSAIGH